MSKILVVDDQPDVLEMTGYVLRAEGYEVIEAANGREALDRARAFRPDLIVCDVMMPGMSGYEVLEAIRGDAALAATPFVFLTAKASSEDLRAGMQLGADDYLTKPFAPADLIAAIKVRLEKYASVHNQFEQKLELLRQGLSTILPHELRTPLTLIMAHASFLLESYDTLDRAAVLDSIRSIDDSAGRLHRLIENLLMYVEFTGDATLRIEHPDLIDAAQLIRTVARERAEAYHRAGDLRLEIQDASLHMHPFHLRKVVDELLDNAFKFSRSGSPIDVSVSVADDDIRICVRDEGRGMTPEELERIEAYVQFNRNRYEQQGGGLGLSVAKRIVKLYNGTFSMESRPEAGTVVCVALRV